MTDKLTDAEVKKALECIAQCKECCETEECQYYMDNGNICDNISLTTDALDLINRQKAEIESLQNKVEELSEVLSDTVRIRYAEARAEAVKDFAKRLKEHKIDVDVSFGYGKEVYTEAVAVIEIDNLVKEMVGDTK